MRNIRHIASVGVLVVLSTIGLYLFFAFVLFNLPTAASAEATPIDVMFQVHFWMMAFLFSLIIVAMLYSAFVFRRKEGDDTDGPHVHSNTALEIGWTIVPTIIVLAFGVYGAVVLNDITAPNEGEMTIEVEGFRFGWRFIYPEYENFTSTRLMLPVDRPVVLEMTSEDVLHAFWVPEFRVKQDLVPGRTTIVRFTPTELGAYKVRCAEICGAGHALMLADVQVVSAAQFENDIAEALAGPAFGEMSPEERGEMWHTDYGCVGCHSLDGSVGVGPSWQGLYLKEGEFDDGTAYTADEEYLRNSILNPNDNIVAGFQAGVMPQNYAEQFAEREAEILASQGVEIDTIEDIIALIISLSDSGE